MESNVHIELEAFDREYGLADLLPRDPTAEWLSDLGGRWAAAVFKGDGAFYCGNVGNPGRWLPDARKALDSGERSFYSLAGTEEMTVVYPLRHELETIGYLALQSRPPAASDELIRLGGFAARAVERMIRLACRTLMTSGLHGRVVEDAFSQLMEKARLLQISEEKYRYLAQRLEAEVQRKGEEIKSTQLIMFQEAQLAAIGRLSAGMAHEINNPIGFVISNLNSLADNAGDLLQLQEHHERLLGLVTEARAAIGDSGPTDGRELSRQAAEIVRLRETLDLDFLKEDIPALITESLEGARRVQTIVRQLSDFAHPSIETAESVDIPQCLDATLAILGGAIGPGVQIRKAYAPTPAVRCHLRALNQVFFHLLRNAVQAVGARGAITLTTKVADNRQVEVTVGDTGPGIDPEQLPHIFDPFFTTRDVGQGAGLGLYLAYNIMKQHGGGITVENRPNDGCLFRVHMPLH